jgi:hypothetical protein
MPVPTPTPIWTERYEDVIEPIFFATDWSITSRSATSAAMKDMLTRAVAAQRLLTSFMHEVNFTSSALCLDASAFSVSWVNLFILFEADTAIFWRLEFAFS